MLSLWVLDQGGEQGEGVLQCRVLGAFGGQMRLLEEFCSNPAKDEQEDQWGQ